MLMLYTLRGSDIERTNRKSHSRIVLLFKSLCLASISKLFLLPIVIWNEQNEFSVKLNFVLVMAYNLYAFIQVHSGEKNSFSTFIWELLNLLLFNFQ